MESIIDPGHLPKRLAEIVLGSENVPDQHRADLEELYMVAAGIKDPRAITFFDGTPPENYRIPELRALATVFFHGEGVDPATFVTLTNLGNEEWQYLKNHAPDIDAVGRFHKTWWKRINQAGVRRRMDEGGQRLSAMSRSSQYSIVDLQQVATELSTLTDTRETSVLTPKLALVRDDERVATNAPELVSMGPLLGLSAIDHTFGGLERRRLTVFGAPPGAIKTVGSLNFGMRLWLQGYRVTNFIVEQGVITDDVAEPAEVEALVLSMLTYYAGIDRMRKGETDVLEYVSPKAIKLNQRVRREPYATWMDNAKRWLEPLIHSGRVDPDGWKLYNNPSPTPSEVIAQLERDAVDAQQAGTTYALAVVDYLTVLNFGDRSDTSEFSNKVGSGLLLFKAWAMKRATHALIMAQLRRDSIQAAGQDVSRIDMTAFDSSRLIEQYGDNIVVSVRPDQFAGFNHEIVHRHNGWYPVPIIVLKNRQTGMTTGGQPLGNQPCIWVMPYRKNATAYHIGVGDDLDTALVGPDFKRVQASL